jgi:hypothetical protein
LRAVTLLLGLVLSTSCRGERGQAEAQATSTPSAPNDAAHQNVTGPHGDHTPRHNGLVLMNGDVHYEVVIARNGHHQIWFSDAVRNDLPASVAKDVRMEITRPGAASETVALAIDDAGESWTASARPIGGEGVIVKVQYSLQGEPYTIEIPVSEAALR